MLERMQIRLSWPRLAGIASGVFGASLAVASAAQFWAADSFRGQGLPGFVASICGCLFLFLAFPLYAGREWARRALLLTTYSVLAALAISFSLMVMGASRVTSNSPLADRSVRACRPSHATHFRFGRASSP